jgi:hypothetical protein
MAFQFRLGHDDGTPADPATLKTAVPNWQAGDTIPLGKGRTLVIDIRSARNDSDNRVLVVVEDERFR